VRTVLEVLPLAVGVRPLVEPSQWRYVNSAMCRLLDYPTPEALLESGPFAVIADEADRMEAMDRRRRLLQGERIGFHVVKWRRRDGAVVPVEVTATVVDFEGTPSIMVLGRDLVERAELTARLAIAERMASLGTLAAGVAHEINSPLTHALLGLTVASVELSAVTEERNDERLRSVALKLRDAREGVERVMAISRSLKGLSRVEDDVRTPIELMAVVGQAAEIVHHELRHRARLVTRFEPVPKVLANAGRLVQVFVNLLANAAQAIPAGRADENEVTIATRLAEDGRVVVEVRDTGAGIPPLALPRIFDPFFTTKAAGDGTGLGLAIGRRIVTELGGTLTAANGNGRGAVFTVVLPAAATTNGGDVVPAGRPSRRPAPTRGRLLIVDDDAILARACQHAVERDFDAHVARSVDEALERLRADSAFDVILCDLMMPTQTGMDFHAAVARSYPHLRDRIVFMTGGAFTRESREFLASVPNARVDKPFTVDGLVAALSAAVPS